CAGATGAVGLSPEGIAGIEELLRRPLAEAHGVGLAERSARDALTVVTSSYEYYGGFRLRTLSACRRLAPLHFVDVDVLLGHVALLLGRRRRKRCALPNAAVGAVRSSDARDRS